MSGLAATAVNATTLDGKEIPEWSGGKILLPSVAVGNELYALELTLQSAAGTTVLQVADAHLLPSGAQNSPYDQAARFAGKTLTVPVFESEGQYYSAELEQLSAEFTAPAKLFEVKQLWPVVPSKLSVPIGGLDYVSGNKHDVTDSQGRFYAVAGNAVDFAIGALDVGNSVSVAEPQIIPYVGLFTSGAKDQAYRSSLRVLGLMDDDNNSVDGLRINDATKQAAASALSGMSLSGGSFDAQYATLTTAVKRVNAGAVAYAVDPALINFQKLEIQTYMIAQLIDKSIPGVALSIELPNGEMWDTAAGLADTQTGEAMTPLHQFRIGSATKSFTAMLIMQLVDEGKLELGQKVEEFFPGMFPDGEEITIKMLLNHTAGIFSFTNEYPMFEQDFGVTMTPPPAITDLWFVRYIGMPGYVYEPGELVEIGSRVNSDFARNNATPARPYLMNAPGQVWNYSNTHYVMLQEIAERLTGHSWESEIINRFVKPLGLTHTIVPSAGDLLMTGTYAHGYINWADNQGDVVADLFGLPHTDIERTNTDPSYTMGSGAIISTTTDLVKWSNAVMEGKLLSPATQKLMREPFHVDGAFGEDINMLQGVVQDLTLQVFGHRGQIAGYDASWQYHYTDPNDVIGTGTAMAVLLNRTLLTEHNADGSPHISDVNEVMLAGILDILYGDE
jgi:D-alanyl-D-alanine carboxypeptidase